MTTLTFTERPGVNAPQLVSEIATALSLTTPPTFAQVDKNFLVSHPNISAGDQSAIQTVITNHTANPLFGISETDLKPFVVTLNGAQPVTWTNMPAALTGLPQSSLKVPLHVASVARFTAWVQVAGFTTAVLIAQFSLDGTNFVNGPQVPINTTGLKVSSLAVVPEAYRTDVFMRLAGQGGNATADPQFGVVTVQFG